MRRMILILIALLAMTLPAWADVNNDVALWLRLRDDNQTISFQSAAAFLQRRSDWPQAAYIRTRAEHALLDQQPDNDTLLQWYKNNPPQCDRGRLAFGLALLQTGQSERGTAFLRDMWQQGFMGQEQYKTLQTIAPHLLTASDHAKRIDTLLWQGQLERAQDALRLLSGEARAVAQARLQLQRLHSQAPILVDNLSTSAQRQSGLIYDRARYYAQKKQDERAFQILTTRQGDVGKYAAQWWRLRALLARRALEKGDYTLAYTLASHHGIADDTDAVQDLADAEWLAGWVATTRLHKPQKGLQHFARMSRVVKSSISQARAAYWAGVAAAQLGQRADADQWYTRAAQHMNTFYGQMAAYALGTEKQAFAAFIKRSQPVPNSTDIPQDLAQAAMILDRMRRDEARDQFLRAAVKTMTTRGRPQNVIGLAQKLHSPEIALAAAKAAYDGGYLVHSALFPKMTLPATDGVEHSLALGIIRQESMFDRYAISPAGAMGLMQIMPRTAAHTAQQFGFRYKKTTQLFDVTLNTTLGQAYLSKLLTKYDGFVPLAAAAYNAGPGNVDAWLATMGDPRQDPRSWVDWVERIPFYETRNYVQRVWEAYSMYKAMK